MSVFIQIVMVSFIVIFLQNAVFERGLGLNIILYAARKKESVIGFSLMIIYIMVTSSCLVYLVNKSFSSFTYYRILMPFFYILIVSVIYVASLVFIWLAMPKLFAKIKSYVHLSVFNASVIGALYLESGLKAGFASYVGYGLGTGIGFLLAGYLLYTAHSRLNSRLVPKAFRGIPIMLIYLGIIALSLYAFVGYTTSIQ